MLAVLTREYRLHCTLGTMEFDGLTIKTIERPWLNNLANKSCIPEGEYVCTYLDRSASGKYKRVWHVQNVEGRTGILFHRGNLVRHSLGCIILGLSHGYLGGQEAVLSSGAALHKMRKHIGENSFNLLVQ